MHLVPVLAILLPGLLSASHGWATHSADSRPAMPPPPTEAAIVPVPLNHGQPAAKVALGKRLFHEPRLSGDDSVSCATCHPIERGGADGLQFSRGVGGHEGLANAPTVINSRFNLAQFWDGRVLTLEEQIDEPIHNPIEMAASWPKIIEELDADSDYSEAFKKLYSEGPAPSHVRNAIATYVRTLISINSPFDRWLRGENPALDPRVISGYQLFLDYGCAACHNGVNVGGNMYAYLGAYDDYFAERGDLRRADLGRYNVTGNQDDRFVFKVPSLRMAASTGPYFHDGSANSLERAITTMARFQLGRDIPEKDVHLLAEFIESLQGSLPADPP